MTDSIYIYVTNLPGKVNEMVCPCIDGYCVYINERLSQAKKEEAYQHAMRHIKHNDLNSEESIDEIEARAHKEAT